MKRFFYAAVMLLILVIGSSAVSEALPDALTLAPGETLEFDLPFQGYWESDAPEVAEGKGASVAAFEEGEAVLVLVSPEGEEWRLSVTVAAEAAEEDEIPALIRVCPMLFITASSI